MPLPSPPRRVAHRLLALAPALALASQAGAAERDHFRYELQLGLEHTDNRLRTAADRDDELLLVPRAAFSVLQGNERVQARANGSLELEQALDGGADDELRARLAAAVDVALLPQRLYWTFQDYADVESVDPLLTDSPANRQQTNVWLTGPSLLLGNAQRWSARAEALVGQGTAEVTPEFDHDRRSVSLSLQRRTDAVRAWSIATESTEVDFERADAADFIRHEALLRFDNQTPRLGIDLSLGHSWINYESGGRTFSWPLARGIVRWTPTGSNELNLKFVQELSDAGRDLAREVEPETRILEHTQRWRVGADVYRLRESRMHWKHTRVRSQWNLSVFGRDFDYLQPQLPLDRESHGARLDGRILLNPRTALLLDAAREDFDFDEQGRRDRDSYWQVKAERRFAPRWLVRAGFAHFRRESNAPGADYRENVVSLFLVYAGGRQ